MRETARPTPDKSARSVKRAKFGFEVAVSATDFDACTAQRLAERLEVRLPQVVFRAWEDRDGAAGAVKDAFVTRTLSSDARLVVVLHQRLWGTTDATRADAEVLERRAKEEGSGFLRMIALESAPRSKWMPREAAWRELPERGIDEVVEEIVSAVVGLGGQARDESPGEIAERTERESGADKEREVFLRSVKAVTGAKREFDGLVEDICKKVSSAVGRIPELAPEMHRTPDRCIVQVGRAGLSLSWMRARSTDVAEARLLIIEWDGTVTPPGAARRAGVFATPLREHELHLVAAGPTSWRWYARGSDGRSYTSSGLAAQCVELLLQRCEGAPS